MHFSLWVEDGLEGPSNRYSSHCPLDLHYDIVSNTLKVNIAREAHDCPQICKTLALASCSVVLSETQIEKGQSLPGVPKPLESK